MKIEQRLWTQTDGFRSTKSNLAGKVPLVLVFGGKSMLQQEAVLQDILCTYPDAYLFGCSTAGEICGTRIHDESLVVTAVQLEHTTIMGVSVSINGSAEKSYSCGEQLAQALETKNLVHVLVLSDGTQVNGSELVRGMIKHLPAGVQVTGGLSADGTNFSQTLVCAKDTAKSGCIAAVGFYGSRLKVGCGSLGGWDPFGPDRMITRARGNILFELDNQPALSLYKEYLGEHAAGLPASGLLFPLCVRLESGQSVVRTILGVNEKENSLTFAGDVPEGTYARLMKANFDRLIDGAQGAAKTSYESIGASSPDLAILISCVGRKLVLKQRTEEEVEAIRTVLGAKTILTGFYSYGEICPAAPNANCELHNQTMTVTTFSES